MHVTPILAHEFHYSCIFFLLHTLLLAHETVMLPITNSYINFATCFTKHEMLQNLALCQVGGILRQLLTSQARGYARNPTTNQHLETIQVQVRGLKQWQHYQQCSAPLSHSLQQPESQLAASYHQPRPSTELSPHRQEGWFHSPELASRPIAQRPHTTSKSHTRASRATNRHARTAMTPRTISVNGDSKKYASSPIIPITQ